MNRLSELKIRIISLVKSPANKQEFLLTKSNKEGIDIPVKLEEGGKLVMDIKLLEEKGLISKEERKMLEKSLSPEGDSLKESIESLKGKIETMIKGKEKIDTLTLTTELKRLNDILIKKDEEEEENKDEKDEKEKTEEEKKKEEEEKEEGIEKSRTEKLVELIKTTNDPAIYKKAVKVLRDGGDMEEVSEKRATESEIMKEIKKVNDKIDSVILKSDQLENGQERKKDTKEKEDREYERTFE